MTPEIAHDAIRALVVEYEVLPHVVIARDALKPESPEVLPRDPRKPDEKNLRLANKTGDVEKVEAALKNCDAIVEAEYSTPRLHHCCLETHGMVVDYSGGDSATVYATTQGTFTIPDDAAKELGLPQSAV
ncbi:MAG: xanthine dehydrogenase family protein molybdopterin-binding subunit, partial [Acidobacteria bacterium]